MLPAERVLGEALALGVQVYLKGERLAYRASRGVPADLLAELGRHKGQIIDYLKEQTRLRGESWSPLVPIRADGTAIPLFLVHPLGGDVFCYRHLAQALGGDQPFYGLQAPGVDGRNVPLEQVEEMAAYYLAAIRDVQPKGPYLLGGWSFGGIVGFEMARQLDRVGEKVSLLVLIDGIAPGNAVFLNAPHEAFARDVAARAGIKPTVPIAELIALPEDVQFATIMEQAVAANFLPADTPVATIKALFEVYSANLRAGARYQPPPFTQPAAFFLAFETEERRKRARAASWRQFVGEGMEVVTVPGDHYSMLRPPFIETFAEQLEARLAAAAAGT